MTWKSSLWDSIFMVYSHLMPMWQLLKNRVLKTRFISLYITKMKSEPKGKKKKTSKKKPRKNQIHPGRDEPQAARAWRPKSRKPGRAACVGRPRSCGLWSSLPLSDLISLSLIWPFLRLWSDPIRWGEAALETQSF